jgi:hypothetical protein
LQHFHEQLLNECNNSSAQKIALHQVLEHEIQSTLESDKLSNHQEKHTHRKRGGVHS